MSPDNLVSFPANGSGRPLGGVCAEFCARWRGSDVAEGARLLMSVLPPRVPGGLQLVLARALGELDVPPFASPEEFRAAVRRFATAPVELVDISDVRRARRASRMTLDRLALATALPPHVLRQLEWGDFREWHHEEWARRVCLAYATAAGLDPVRVREIVGAERGRQLAGRPADRPVAIAPPAVAPRRGVRFVAAAAAVFAAGLLAGGALVHRAADQPPAAGTQIGSEASAPDRLPSPQEDRAPADAVPASGEVAANDSIEPPGEPARADSGDPAGGERSTSAPSQASPAPSGDASGASPNSDQARPRSPAIRPRALRTASVAGPAAFSPAFSNVGSAVFYHRDEGAGTALMKADTDASTGDLKVISLVQDGARNYHVKPSPDGSHIAFDSDRDGERGVYIANADGTNVRRVSGPGFAAVPSWAPDGTRLAFVRGEPSGGSRVWNLWLLDLASNTSVRLTANRYGQPWGASWFPDGRRLAYSHEDRLNVLDLQTGRRRLFRSPRAGKLVRTPAVSPNGRHIVFQVYRDGAWLLDLRDGSMQRILADPTAEEFAWDASGRRLAFHSRRSGEWSVWIMSTVEGPTS